MISNDIKLKQLFLRKNLSESRVKHYIKTLTEVYEITGKTPSELIVEAKEEEQPYLHNNVPRIRDIDDRKIISYLYSYYECLLKKNIIDSIINFI